MNVDPVQAQTHLLAMAGSQLEWTGQTVVHPVALALLAAACILVLSVPRRYLPAVLLVLAGLIAPAQRVVIADLDFSFSRIVILLTLARGVAGGLIPRRVRVDYAVIVFSFIALVAYSLQQMSISAFVFRVGMLIEIIGAYFVFRMGTRSLNDLRSLCLCLALLAIPTAALFLVEKSTGFNSFSAFGGVPAITAVREGKLRAQGAYSHPIMAGVVWSSVIPLLIAFARVDIPRRLIYVVGMVASMLIVIASASSTPLVALILGFMGMAAWPLRAWVRPSLPILAVALVVIHFLSPHPVWHLVSRIDLVGGSTGWHRYFLIDQFISRFAEWVLVGTPSTAHWGLGLQDVTNQFVLEAVRGGLPTLVVFVAVILAAYKSVSLGLRRSVALNDGFVIWAIGVTLTVHLTSFIAVSYFGQADLYWSLSLALCAAAPMLACRRELAPAGLPCEDGSGKHVMHTRRSVNGSPYHAS